MVSADYSTSSLQIIIWTIHRLLSETESDMGLHWELVTLQSKDLQNTCLRMPQASDFSFSLYVSCSNSACPFKHKWTCYCILWNSVFPSWVLAIKEQSDSLLISVFQNTPIMVAVLKHVTSMNAFVFSMWYESVGSIFKTRYKNSL